MTLFEHIDNLTYHKKRWSELTEEDKKTYNPYIVNRFISMHYPYIDLVNELQKLDLPPHVLYEMYISCLPKHKKYFKYIKKSIKETKGDEIEIISKVFEVSRKEALSYLELLDKNQVESLKLQITGIKEKKKK